jgi:fluoride exporter
VARLETSGFQCEGEEQVLQKLVLLALMGAVGTLARYGLQGLVQSWTGQGFPWGTLAVNVVGCFLFGLVWCLAEERMVISGQTRVIILVGFMGAFTTFSSFAFETGQLMRDSQWWMAVGNVAAQNILGVVFLFLGFALGRLF